MYGSFLSEVSYGRNDEGKLIWREKKRQNILK